VLCFDLLPRETALQQIREVRADHAWCDEVTEMIARRPG
jgi:hypothetical protein